MNPFRVTLIDDNLIFRLVFGKLMSSYEPADIQLTAFDNPVDALEYFRNHYKQKEMLPEILFIDINMPFMTGWELLDVISAEGLDFVNSIPVYIISSSTSASDFEQANRFPFVTGYLNKPVTKQDLYEKISLSIV